MNATGRKRLNEIHSILEGLKDEISTMASDEQEKFDNMSEGLQQGDRGQKIEVAANALSECESSFDDIIGNIDTATED